MLPEYDKGPARLDKRDHEIYFNGVTHTIKEWAEIVGITTSTMYDRLQKWPVEQALTTPPYGDKRPKEKNECVGCAYYRRLDVWYGGGGRNKCCWYALITKRTRSVLGPDGRGHAPHPCTFRRTKPLKLRQKLGQQFALDPDDPGAWEGGEENDADESNQGEMP